MSAGQQALGIEIGDRAGGSDVHVAANENRANGGARFKGLGLLCITDRTRTHHGNDACRGKLRSEELYSFFAEAVEDEGSFNGLQVVRVGLDGQAGRFSWP